MRIAALLVLAALTVATASASLYGAKSPVVQLTPANFDAEVLNSDAIWLVEFYAPWCGHCKALTPEWEKAAKALSGSVKIGAVDADTHRELGGKYKVEGFPTIKVFGTNKNAPTDYEGGRKAADIVAAALKVVRSITNERLGIKEDAKKDAPPPPPKGGAYENTDVVELTDDTFESDVLNGKEPYLVEFYAPWCGHCKNLIPEWKKAATALVGTIKIAAIDATAHTKFNSKYKIEGFPTIKFFPPGGEAEDYQGGRDANAIIAFGEKKGEAYPSKPVVVNQLDAASIEECYKKTTCVVFVVPHVIDTGAEGRNKLLAIFGEVAKSLRQRASFGWIVGGEHEAFENAFHISGSYPTYVVVNHAKKRFATHKGRFDQDGISTGIKKILDGKQGTSTAAAIPALAKDVPLWDGKDYVSSD